MNTWRTDFTVPDGATNTLLRTRIAELEAAIVATGLVKVAATGELVASAATVPTGFSVASVGFQVFRFDDPRQIDAPVFIRLEYWTMGSSNPGTSRSLDIRNVTVGSTHDGAGVVGGQAATISQVLVASQGGNELAATSLLAVSGSTSRLTIAMACWGVAGTKLGGLTLLNVERLKGATGGDTAGGAVFAFNGHTVVLPASGPIPPTETRFGALCSTNDPGRFNNQSSIGLIHPFAGIAQRPLTGLAIAPASAFAASEILSAVVYGATVAYRATAIASTSNAIIHQTGPRFLVRWD